MEHILSWWSLLPSTTGAIYTGLNTLGVQQRFLDQVFGPVGALATTLCWWKNLLLPTLTFILISLITLNTNLLISVFVCFKGRNGYCRVLPRFPFAWRIKTVFAEFPKKLWAPSTPRGWMRSLDHNFLVMGPLTFANREQKKYIVNNQRE